MQSWKDAINIQIYIFLGFPGGSDGKESACNARDPYSIPGSGRFPGEGKDHPVQSTVTSFQNIGTLCVMSKIH